MRIETNQWRNRYRRTKLNKIYQQKLKDAQRQTWRSFVEAADEKTIWNIKKYMNSTPTQHYIPTLNETVAKNKEKAQEFIKTFFPPPPPADLSDIMHAECTTEPDPVPCDTNITRQQLRRIIQKLSPNKAPRPDGIINKVLKENSEMHEPHLMTLIQASLDTGHFPTPFKKTITVVLRKPLKPDYTKPNAYRPIALENTIGKVIESIITELISYLIETHGLLPANDFGGRPQRTTTDAMTVLTESIHY